MNPEDKEIIPKMISNIKKWFEKAQTDQFLETWKQFIEVSLNEGETIEEFILKYDTLDSKLKSCN